MGVYGNVSLKGFEYFSNWVFREHRPLLEEYLDNVWQPIEHSAVLKAFKKEPGVAYHVLNDFHNNKTDPNINWQRVLDYIAIPGNDVIIISGGKRAGKSYDGWRMIHALRNDYDPHWIGEPVHIPNWASTAVDIYSTPKDSICLVDEAAVRMNNRNAMSNSNKKLLEILPVIAHTGRKVIFITQNTSRSDIALLSWADVHIMKAYTGIYGLQMEREMVHDRRDDFFLPLLLNEYGLPNKKWSYVKAGGLTGMYRGYDLPWYDDTISKTFNSFENEKDAMVYATRMATADYEAREIEQIMRLKSYIKPVDYWEKFVIKVRMEPAKAIQNTQYGDALKAMA